MNNNIQIHKSIFALPHKERLLRTCSTAFERIAAIAPSDSNVSLHLSRVRGHFLVKVVLASHQLMFSAQASEKSVFSALENVLSDSLLQIRGWSEARNLQALT